MADLVTTTVLDYLNVTVTITEMADDCRHSVDDNPSRVTINKLSHVVSHSWHSYNHLHRTTGPAKIDYTDKTLQTVTSCSYWVNGKNLTREEFERLYLVTHLKVYDGI